jgi:hypothetical protein
LFFLRQLFDRLQATLHLRLMGSLLQGSFAPMAMANIPKASTPWLQLLASI